MKKSMICGLGLLLFLLGGTVFAANWVYIRSDQGIDGSIKVYIDTESVVKNGNDLMYWGYALWSQPIGNVKGEETKYEVQLAYPRQYREVEVYDIDVNNNIKKNLDFSYPGNWYQVTSNVYNQEIDFALQYAKEGQDAGAKSMIFDYAVQGGPYIRKVRGTVKDPPGLWQALLPLQPPPGARGGYGLIGDDNLLGQAPGFGLRQLGSIARRYITFDSVYVVQPPGFEEIGVQTGVFTSIAAMNDTTLGWVFFDLRPKFEADLKRFLNL